MWLSVCLGVKDYLLPTTYYLIGGRDASWHMPISFFFEWLVGWFVGWLVSERLSSVARCALLVARSAPNRYLLYCTYYTTVHIYILG